MTPSRQPLIAPALLCVGMVLATPAQSRINITALIALTEDPQRLSITLPFAYQRDLGASPGSDSPQLLTVNPIAPLRLGEEIDLFATALLQRRQT